MAALDLEGLDGEGAEASLSEERMCRTSQTVQRRSALFCFALRSWSVVASLSALQMESPEHVCRRETCQKRITYSELGV